jgi:hypothetical protein
LKKDKGMTPRTPIEPESETTEAAVRLIAFGFRHVFVLAMSVAFLMITSSFFLLLYSRRIATAHGFQKDFLVNVAAGLVEIAIGTALAAVATWAVAKNKLRQLSRPVLALIQRLRIDGKLTEEGARRSVVCAVALLSESNVSKEIQPDLDKPNTDCPICTQQVTEQMNQCFYCQLPKTIWNDAELVQVHQKNLATGRGLTRNDGSTDGRLESKES